MSFLIWYHYLELAYYDCLYIKAMIGMKVKKREYQYHLRVVNAKFTKKKIRTCTILFEISWQKFKKIINIKYINIDKYSRRIRWFYRA